MLRYTHDTHIYVFVSELEPQVTKPKRMTRSMTHDQQTCKLSEMVDEVVPPFIIDESLLPALLDRAVSVGLQCSLAQLEKLYSLLAQQVYHHHNSYDRTLLLQVSAVNQSSLRRFLVSNFVGEIFAEMGAYHCQAVSSRINCDYIGVVWLSYCRRSAKCKQANAKTK